MPYSRTQRAVIVALAFAATVFDGADFTIFLFYMAPLAEHLHVSLLALSSIQASSYVIGIVGGVLFGRFADRRGRRLGLFATIITFSVFTLATTAVHSYAALFVIRILAGIGIGGESGIAFAYINEAFPGRDQRRGLVSGLLQSMFLVGAWFAAWIYQLTAVVGTHDWRTSFGILGSLGLICALCTLAMPESQMWLQRESERRAGGAVARGETPVGIRELLAGLLGRRVLIASALLAASFYGAYAVYTYGPTMWQSVYHLTPKQVGSIGMTSAILGAISYIVGGALSDALGRRRAYIVTAVVGVAAYATFAAVLIATHAQGAVSSAIVLPAYFFLQIGYGYFGVQGVWLSELFPTAVRTTAQNAIYYTGRAIGGGGAPIAGLWIVHSLRLNLSAAVAFGAAGAICAVVFARLLPETRGEQLQM